MKQPSRIRVMYVVPDLGVGGAERQVTTLMPNLDRSQFDTAVVCIGREGQLFDDLAGSRTKAVALHRTKRQAVPALLDLMREVRTFAPDVVIARGYNAEILGRVAAWLTGVSRTVVWVHNHSDVEPRGPVRRTADHLLDRVTSAYFGVAKAQTDYLVNDLKYSRDKIRVIYNGVDTESLQWTIDRPPPALRGIDESNKVVGIIAAMRPEKDHANFLRAARLVADRVPEAKFLIVGDGPMRPEIERLVDEFDLHDRVVLTGYRADVPDILRAMDVFVLSSFSVECFPMALLEAMAAGLPAVCTAVGGVPEMIEDAVTGYVVPPHDPDALAGRLVRILTETGLGHRMGRAARIRVESLFSLRTSVSATERALAELVETKRILDLPLRLTVVLDLASIGGVEMLLLNMFKHFNPGVVVPRLVCLREAGPLADEFRAAGFDVEVLDRSGRFDIRTLSRLVRSLRAAHTDAVLVTHHHRASLALGRIAARVAQVPVNIIAAHDMDLALVGKRVLPRWAVNTLAFSDALVLLSSSQGEYLHREEGVGRRLNTSTWEVVIPNGIQLPDFPTTAVRSEARKALGVADTDFVVGIVARLSAQKAHEVLFRAIAECVASVPRVRLVLIGGGVREVELQNLAEILGIGSRTTFLGIRHDVGDLLPGLDVACLSSVHEGVPIALIEAMAAGLPIVATDCGSIGDIVEDGEHGFVVPVGDVANFSDRLQRLAHDESLRIQLGKNGRARVEREFRIEYTTRRYEELLTKLVSAHK